MKRIEQVRQIVISSAMIAAFTGCVMGEEYIPEPFEDVEQGVVVLEGNELVRELMASPAREAPESFVRLGLLFDAARPQALEVATSADGQTWSAWSTPAVHHSEVEGTSNFVGQIELPAGESARFYRLRATDLGVSFVRMELLAFRQSEHIESGEDGVQPLALTRPVGSVDVHLRGEWGARPANCSSSLGTVYRMAIHHTETPTNDSMTPQARLRQIQSYHMDVKGWCDIGYHYLVSRDGRVWEGRPDTQLGSHAGGANTGNIGISIMGQHEATPVTQAQVDVIAGLVRGLATAHGVPMDRTRIKGHREYKSTSCPGDALFAQLGGIVDAAKNGTGGGTGGGGTGGGGTGGGTGGGGATVTVMGVLYAGADTATRISGATVTLGTQTVTTSTTGAWQFAGVPVGSFTVSASKTGYMTRSLTRTTDGAETWASFGLSPANAPTGTAILQGVIYYGTSSANRIPNATVTLSTGQTLTADANGYYKLSNLPPGTVTIAATAPGYATASVTRTLANGVTEWGSVKLAP
ncbi:MAG TPA: N-acetylmuramoyl-L-alanine amidase [Kofleriaceae bacterium]|nr:N-acetylmuramoyl-L-alanine amidase [Kofleriaceae bacterium]